MSPLPHSRLYDNRHRSNPIIVADVLSSPAERLSREIKLFDEIASGKALPLITLWRSSACIVVPEKESRANAFNVASSVCAKRGWPVVCRKTGGTAFPIGSGTVQVSFFRVVRADDYRGIGPSYCALCEPIVSTFRELGVDATLGPIGGALCDGTYNICVAGKKIAGTAQRQRRLLDGRVVILAHAAITITGPLAPAIAAVQEYYRILGSSVRFDANRHVALSDCLGEGSDGSDETWRRRIIRRLGVAYQRHGEAL